MQNPISKNKTLFSTRTTRVLKLKQKPILKPHNTY